MDAGEARRRFASARVARLATVTGAGLPHLVPVVFATRGDEVVLGVDDVKPKRTDRLARVANIAERPAVALLADHYDDLDWSRLWWVRGDGTGRVLDAASDASGADEARRLLSGRYRQYADHPPPGPFVVVAVQRWSGWQAGDGPGS